MIEEKRQTIGVSRIRIDETGRLHVVPASNPDKMFRFIYRAAMEVDWDEDQQSFYTPAPRELSYADWYVKVLEAVRSEMGMLLSIDNTTVWDDISPALEQTIRHRNQVS